MKFAVVQFPGEDSFGPGRVVHTLGYPNPASVFGGVSGSASG